MEYCLRSGLNFNIAAAALQLLKERSPDLIQTGSQPWLIVWDGRKELLEIVEFDGLEVITDPDSKLFEWLKAKRVVIPLCLDISNLIKQLVAI